MICSRSGQRQSLSKQFGRSKARSRHCLQGPRASRLAQGRTEQNRSSTFARARCLRHLDSGTEIDALRRAILDKIDELPELLQSSGKSPRMLSRRCMQNEIGGLGDIGVASLLGTRPWRRNKALFTF